MAARSPLLRRGLALILAPALWLSACLVAPPDPASTAADAVVQIHGSGGEELGVSTGYGIAFLGATQRGGTVEYSAWFGDGPSPESGLVEPVGGGLFVTRPEIAIHRVRIDFHTPKPGTKVHVVARKGRHVLEIPTRVVAIDGVKGLLLASNGALRRLGSDATGAGVFVGEGSSAALVGLLSGELVLERADGPPRRAFTAVGPDDLWRLAARVRAPERPRRPRGRADLGPR